MVWGPNEKEVQQGLTCVTSVNTTWKTLVAAAQEKVLDKLSLTTGQQLQISRQQGPHGAADDGIVAQITKVSLSLSTIPSRLLLNEVIISMPLTQASSGLAQLLKRNVR